MKYNKTQKRILAIWHNIININKSGFTGLTDRFGRRIYKHDTFRSVGYVSEVDGEYGIMLKDAFISFKEPHFWNWFNPESSELFLIVEGTKTI